MFTAFIAQSCISNAFSLSIVSPFCTIISPVNGLTTSSAATWLSSLIYIASFLLNLYLPTLDKSYLLASKNKEFINESALSTVGGSPGLNLLYISSNASSLVLVLSFSIVAFNLSSSPNQSTISASLPNPNALIKILIGSFLVLSILTYIMSLESVSYSNHAPLLGITVDENSFFPVLSTSYP